MRHQERGATWKPAPPYGSAGRWLAARAIVTGRTNSKSKFRFKTGRAQADRFEEEKSAFGKAGGADARWPRFRR
jgi:hypothetical protein